MKNLLFGIVASALVAGCGNSWEMTKKNFRSNYIDLKREVVVYDSVSGKELWRFTGVVYLSDASKPGNLSFVYKDNRGEYRKVDFLGYIVTASMKEVSE